MVRELTKQLTGEEKWSQGFILALGSPCTAESQCPPLAVENTAVCEALYCTASVPACQY